MYHFPDPKRSGFTLVELLIVVAIVGLLSSVVLMSVNEARKQARDKEAQTNLKQVELALELYKEAHGRYPEGCKGGWSGGLGGHACTDGSPRQYILDLTPTFLPELPWSPRTSHYGYLYNVNGDGSGYKMMYWQMVESEDVDSGHQFQRCPQWCQEEGYSGGGYEWCRDGTANFDKTYAVYVDPTGEEEYGPKCW